MIVGLDNSGKTSILKHLMSLNNIVSVSKKHSQSSNLINTKTTNLTSISTTSALQEKLATNRDERGIAPTVGYNYERIQYKNLTIIVLDFSGQSRYRNLWQEFYNGVDGIMFVIDSSDLIRFVVVRDELETLLAHPYFGTLDQSDQSSSFLNNSSLAAQKQFTVSQGKLIQTPLGDSSSSLNHAIGSSLNPNISKRSTISQQTRKRTKVPILFVANKSDLPNSADIDIIAKALNLNQLPVQRHPWFIKATSVNSGQGIIESFDWILSQLFNTTMIPN